LQELRSSLARHVVPPDRSVSVHSIRTDRGTTQEPRKYNVGDLDLCLAYDWLSHGLVNLLECSCFCIEGSLLDLETVNYHILFLIKKKISSLHKYLGPVLIFLSSMDQRGKIM